MSTDTIADLRAARRAVTAALRELVRLEAADPTRPTLKATFDRARKRYTKAVLAQEKATR